MTLAINTNAFANVVSHNLHHNQAVLQQSLNRLSSGSKIVASSDDVGGIAVSANLTAKLGRSFRTQQNVQNSLSYLQVQDGVLAKASQVLDRMSELKTMSLDPTKNSSDIASYNVEFMELGAHLKALRSEKFNDIQLFGQDQRVGASNSIETKTTEDGETGSVSLDRNGFFDRLSGKKLNQKAISSTTYTGTNGTDYSTLTISTPTHGLTARVTIADGVVPGSVNGSDLAAAVQGINNALESAGIQSVFASEDADGRLVITGTERYTLSESVFGSYSGLDLASTESIVSLNAGEAGDTYQVSINGNSIASGPVAFNTDLNRTALNLVSAIRNDATLNSLVKATADGASVILTSLAGAGLSVETIVTGTAEAPLLATLNGVASSYEYDALAEFRAGDVVTGVRANGTRESYQVLSHFNGVGRSFDEFAVLSSTSRLNNSSDPQTKVFQSGVDPVAQVDTVTLTGGGDGDGYNVTINGYSLAADVAFNTDVATTAADLAAAINADATLHGLVTAADAGGGALTLTAWNAGTAFSASATHQSNNIAAASSSTTSVTTIPTAQVDTISLTGGGGATAQVDTISLTGGGGATAQVDTISLTGGGGATAQVDTISLTGGGGAVAQIDTISLTGGGGTDTFDITVDGNSIAAGPLTFDTDLATTASNIANAINADPALSAIVTASAVGADLTLTANSAGTAFAASSSSTDNGGGAAATDATTTANVAADTFDVTVDGNSITAGPLTFDTDLATTASNLANAINADPTLSAIVTASVAGADLTLTANSAGTAFAASSSPTDNGGGAATTDSTTTANVAADTFDVTVDGNSITAGPLSFDTDLATTATNLANAINADPALSAIVTASTSGTDLTLTANSAGTAFAASSSPSDNGGGAASTDVTTTANVAADTFDVTVDGNSIAAGPLTFDTNLATTASNLVNAINADPGLSAIVTASASGGDLTLTANSAGTAFAASSSPTDNGGGAASTDVTTTANVVADTFDVTVDGNSIAAGPLTFDTNLATTASNLADAINADPGLSAIVTASASGGDLTLTANSAGTAFAAASSPTDNGGGAASTDATTTANDPGLPQVDTVTLSAGGGNDTFNITVNGNSLAAEVSFDTDLATTAANLAAAINADATISAIVTAADAGGGSLTLTAVTNGATFTSSASSTDSTGVTSATTTTNVSSQGTTHQAGEVVYNDSNGRYYLSRGDGTWENNTTKASDTSNLEEFLDLGETLPELYDYDAYDSGNLYSEDDIVRYGDNLYVATTSIGKGEGVPIHNTTNWVRLNAIVSGVNDLLEADKSIHDFSIQDLKDFIQLVATARAQNGAETSSLEMSSELLSTNSSNLESYKSTLMDVDIATESTKLARASILVQSSASILAQANASQSVALTLLQ